MAQVTAQPAEGAGGVRPDRNLALELVRVTEMGAIGAGRWVGRGDKNSADAAAVDGMRLMLDTVSMNGRVVIGEGEKDEAPMLYNGEEVGDGTGPEVDVAVDPLEGTRLCALAQPNAIAVMAVAERGTMFFPGAAFYMEKIGVDAARWYLVSRGADQPIDIDVDLAREQTQKNPVYYVQYAHARIAGIVRNAEKKPNPEAAPATLDPLERDLLKRLTDFPTIVVEATERRAPHALPIYAIRVADDFHRFYHDLRVVGSEEEEFRLALCRGTQHVIARCLDLIGVEAPERM